MATNYEGPGDVIQYSNAGSAIASGDVVVLGTNSLATVGVALCDIAATSGVGSVAISGAFRLAKVSAAVIKAGESVDWDVSGLAVDDNQMTAASGDVSNFGVALEDAGNGVLTVLVRLLPGVGTKT